jgi:hypothetical protein
VPSRVIRGEINSSRSLERVSMLADLAFRALLVVVDDYGRFDGRLYILRNAMFPTRREVTEAKLAKWLDELEREGCIRRYVVDGAPYVELPTWEKHRGKGRRAESSKYPESLSPRKSEDLPGIPGDPRSERMVLSEGIGTRGEGIERGAPPAAAPAAVESRPRKVVREKTEAPEDLDDADKMALMLWCREKYPQFSERKALRDLVDSCLDWHRAEGKQRRSWLAACRWWIRKQVDFGPNRGSRSNGHAERRTETADETQRMLQKRRDYIERAYQEARAAEAAGGIKQ